LAASCLPNSDGNAVSAALFPRNGAFVSFDLLFFGPPAAVTPLVFRRARSLNGSNGRARRAALAARKRCRLAIKARESLNNPKTGEIPGTAQERPR
jgi:hypothetical protein